MKNTITEKAMSVSLAKDLVNSIPYGTKFRQVRSMNAYITDLVEINNGLYRFIKSYNTVVAIFDYDNETYTEFGKYSVTTSKQVTTIYNIEFARGGVSREFNPERIY